MIASPNGDWLQQVADLIQSGKAIARVDCVFPLEETAQAMNILRLANKLKGRSYFKFKLGGHFVSLIRVTVRVYHTSPDPCACNDNVTDRLYTNI